MTRPYTLRLRDMTWQEAERASSQADYALLPVAAVEEHGPHLPVDTDIAIADALAEEVAAATGGLLLPTLPYGQVYSLHDFPGSLTLSAATFKDVVKELVDSLRRHNLKQVVILVCHGGNLAPAKEAAREAMAAWPDVRVLHLMPDFTSAAKDVRESPSWHPFWLHAEEIETSLMLTLCPDRVRMDRAVRAYPERPPYFDHAPLSWRRLSPSGVFGDPTLATAAKGQAIMRNIVKGTAAVINAWLDDLFPPLQELVTPGRCRPRVEVGDWRQVVEIAGAMLVQDGLASPRYTRAMGEAIERHGPYVVLTPGFALLHARPEDGALGTGLAVVTLVPPVTFGHPQNDPVRVAVALSAQGSRSHVRALRELAEAVSNPVRLEDLHAATSPEEMAAVLAVGESTDKR